MRTVKDFVYELQQEGKSSKHIKAVAACTHWDNKMDEVEKLIGKKKKKKKIKVKIKRK